MIRLPVLVLCIGLTIGAAGASDLLPWRQFNGQEIGGTVINCAAAGSPTALPCGTADDPLVSTPVAPRWAPAASSAIATANTYQVLFAAGAALRGATVVNTSPPSLAGSPLWVDVTGATGGTLSNGAMPVYAAPDAVTAPGAWRVPPSSGPITIYGPAGATFRAFAG